MLPLKVVLSIYDIFDYNLEIKNCFTKTMCRMVVGSLLINNSTSNICEQVVRLLLWPL